MASSVAASPGNAETLLYGIKSGVLQGGARASGARTVSVRMILAWRILSKPGLRMGCVQHGYGAVTEDVSVSSG